MLCIENHLASKDLLPWNGSNLLPLASILPSIPLALRESLKMDSHHAGGPTNPSNAMHLIAFASSRWQRRPSAAAVFIMCSGQLAFVSTSASNKQQELLMRGGGRCITARWAVRWRWGLIMGGERRLAEAGINDKGDSLKTQRGSGDAVPPRRK